MRALISGSSAAVASTLVLLAMGRRELDDAAAPLNGPSQWIWGRHAPYRDGFSIRHTAVGYGIHHSAALLWGVLYEAIARKTRNPVVAATVTTVTASIVDFKLTPERFMPGFEKRLSRRALVGVYAAFAVGLALSTLARRSDS